MKNIMLFNLILKSFIVLLFFSIFTHFVLADSSLLVKVNPSKTTLEDASSLLEDVIPIKVRSIEIISKRLNLLQINIDDPNSYYDLWNLDYIKRYLLEKYYKEDQTGYLLQIENDVYISLSESKSLEYSTDKNSPQWFWNSIKVPEVPEVPLAKNITVAVLDTGISPEHKDLQGKFVFGRDFVDNDYEAYPEKYSPSKTPRNYNLEKCYPNSLDTFEDYGTIERHGTVIAGLIAASNLPNSKFPIGIAPMANIMPLRVVGGSCQTASLGSVIKAIEFAIDGNVDLINISLSLKQESQFLYDIFEEAKKERIIITISAGNNALNFDNFDLLHPKYYELPNVIIVGATAEGNLLAPFSNYGDIVDIFAPGRNIISTSTDDSGYYNSSGTSVSSAIIAGSIALIKSHFSDLTNTQIINLLKQGGDKQDFGTSLNLEGAWSIAEELTRSN